METSPKYPIYIVSKGRWESRLTSKALERMRIPYSIVVEPQEYGNYAAAIEPKKILVLPFGNLGLGSIPARNWTWEHSVSIGAEKHWVLDDNISFFYRSYQNKRHHVLSSAIFRCSEDFTDRYENIALSGMNYGMFAPDDDPSLPAYYLNTRIYSCILIRNDIPYRWRGRYNEDTDLSLRALKDGWCTVLFNAFLAQKKSTMTMKGGNTDELYRNDGRLKMAQSLVEQHPDVAKITWKFNRWQHQVDYSPFKKNKLIKKGGIVVPDGVNNYGMTLSFEKKYMYWLDENKILARPSGANGQIVQEIADESVPQEEVFHPSGQENPVKPNVDRAVFGKGVPPLVVDDAIRWVNGACSECSGTGAQNLGGPIPSPCKTCLGCGTKEKYDRTAPLMGR